jgi:uncharacterized protein (TIGR00251 family)
LPPSCSQQYYQWQADKLVLYCHLQANASKDEWCGRHGSRLKIRIAALAIDNKANLQLIRFIAKQFGVPRSAVVINSGLRSKLKTLYIDQPAILPKQLAIKHN